MSTQSNDYIQQLDGDFNFNETAKKLLTNPLIAKDVWSPTEELGLVTHQHNYRFNFNFKSIRQEWFKLLVKLYVIVRSQRNYSAEYIAQEICFLSVFSNFIERKSIFNFDQFNDQIFDEFNYYLYAERKIKHNTIISYLGALKNFFNLCSEEDWIKVNTYWFKGKLKDAPVKRDEIEYIPQEVWQQLDEQLHHLPEQFQRIVVIIRATGLRIGELLNLPLDCLRKRGEQWRLRFSTEKCKIEDELPICEELVTLVREQQEYIRKHFGDSYKNLFSGYYYYRQNGKYKPAPRTMRARYFSLALNEFAIKQNISTKTGKTWHFKSHQFRKTVATIMTNAGVRDLIIQRYLRHRSPDMQDYYKRLYKEVLGDEYHKLMKDSKYVDSTGKLVAQYQPQNPITELLRMKMYQTTTQYGECHRPILKAPCETVNACWQCEHWLTSTEDISALKNDLQKVDAELDIASRLGMVRQQQGLALDQQRLVIRIECLEKINDRY